MRDYVIKHTGDKTRQFKATCVALVSSGALLDQGQGGVRPSWAMFAGSEQALRPFVANLRLGRKADENESRPNVDRRLEFLKSEDFQVAWQKEPEGCLVTLYHPDLFRLDPGMVDPKKIGFLLLVPDHWVQKQTPDPEAVLHIQKLGYAEEMARFAPVAALFAAYLDRRTRCPLVADPRFYLQLLCAGLTHGMVSIPYQSLGYIPSYAQEDHCHAHHSFHAIGMEDAGLHTALSVLAKHEDFERLLADQVKVFFGQT